MRALARRAFSFLVLLVALVAAQLGLVLALPPRVAEATGVGKIQAVVRQMFGGIEIAVASTPTDGDALTYDSTTRTWKPEAAAGGGGGGGWTDGDTIVTTTTATDGVGIGQAAPGAASKLEVLGDATRKDISLETGENGDFYVFGDNFIHLDGPVRTEQIDMALGSIGFTDEGHGQPRESSFTAGRVTLTDNSAITVAVVALAAGARCGGTITFTIEATDGTDVQALSGQARFAAVNKGGVYTTQIVGEDAVEANVVTDVAGELVANWSITTGSNLINLRLTADTTLVTTTFRVQLQVQECTGAVVTVQ